MTAVPLRVRIGPSRCLAGLLVLVHALACAVLYPLALAEALKLALAAVIAVSGTHSVLKTALLRSRDAIVALEIGDEGVAIRGRHVRQWRACRVLGTTFVSSHLTVLNLELVTDGTVRHVVLLPDNVDRGDFRRLRVWLRWNAPTAVKPVATRSFGRAIRRAGRPSAVDAAEE